MQRAIFCLMGALGILVTGCQSPKFTYQAPAANLNSFGPSILVMPLIDCRTNRDMDKILEKGYLVDVQKAIGDELQGMDFFSSVTVITNEATLPKTDWRLSPTVRRLEWEIPDYGALEAKAVVVGLLTGVVGGAIYASTSIDVYGHSALDIRVFQATNDQAVFNFQFSDIATNRLKKAVCDTPKTQASMMVQAFQKSMDEFKADLKKELLRPGSATNIINGQK